MYDGQALVEVVNLEKKERYMCCNAGVAELFMLKNQCFDHTFELELLNALIIFCRDEQKTLSSEIDDEDDERSLRVRRDLTERKVN